MVVNWAHLDLAQGFTTDLNVTQGRRSLRPFFFQPQGDFRLWPICEVATNLAVVRSSRQSL